MVRSKGRITSKSTTATTRRSGRSKVRRRRATFNKRSYLRVLSKGKKRSSHQTPYRSVTMSIPDGYAEMPGGYWLETHQQTGSIFNENESALDKITDAKINEYFPSSTISRTRTSIVIKSGQMNLPELKQLIPLDLDGYVRILASDGTPWILPEDIAVESPSEDLHPSP